MKKKYYSIGETANHFGVEQYVLRFWEKEFSCLCPKKSAGGSRRYQQRDFDIIEKILYLLYEELYTIEGAKRKLTRLLSIPLDDYKKTEKMLCDPVFVQELQHLLNML
ncbi:MerR family transcriptional regulator [Chitinivibrio alkaliphilus]|uniref:MerR family transcriptional regulator n=1 Tax=Chitinivibrio alkaliphilus ACht1 TaxID=1313304 RepID=U7D430_9BACT|nr:MerR family transcriptional regulator [Chitinivibrio alkaliphilus]ERP31269.1 MerR family transcriptional regulator [Chitinivibrio alkaliphilus ACht1]